MRVRKNSVAARLRSAFRRREGKLPTPAIADAGLAEPEGLAVLFLGRRITK